MPPQMGSINGPGIGSAINYNPSVSVNTSIVSNHMAPGLALRRSEVMGLAGHLRFGPPSISLRGLFMVFARYHALDV